MNLEAELLAVLQPAIAIEVERQLARRNEFEWPWGTPEKAGELLGISADAVRHRIARGKIPARKFDGRWLVDMKALDRRVRAGAIP